MKSGNCANAMLEGFLFNQQLGPLGLTNFAKHAIHQAVAAGVPVETIVLLLLFPLLAGVIAALRHLVGIRGFGIFTPAMISLAFYATGVIPGILLFLAILFIATAGRLLIRKLKIHYLLRMALLFWFISLMILFVILATPALGIQSFITFSIFPILILIILAENFIGVQMAQSRREAIKVTSETLLLAFVCLFLLHFPFLQKFVLLNPELTIFGIAVFDILIGRFTGLRLLEYRRFRRLLR